VWVGMLGVGLKRLALRIVPRSVVRWRGSDRDYFFVTDSFYFDMNYRLWRMKREL